MLKIIMSKIVLFLIIFHSTICIASSKNDNRSLTIGTGDISTGIYYTAGDVITKSINKNKRLHGISIDFIDKSTSISNINSVIKGDFDFGLAESNHHYQAFNGLGPWKNKGRQSDLRVILSIGSTPTSDLNIMSYGSKVTLVTSADVPDDVIYKVTKIIFKEIPSISAYFYLNPYLRLKEEYRELIYLNQSDMLEGLSIPVHPGALKFYKETVLMNTVEEKMLLSKAAASSWNFDLKNAKKYLKLAENKPNNKADLSSVKQLVNEVQTQRKGFMERIENAEQLRRKMIAEEQLRKKMLEEEQLRTHMIAEEQLRKIKAEKKRTSDVYKVPRYSSKNKATWGKLFLAGTAMLSASANVLSSASRSSGPVRSSYPDEASSSSCSGSGQLLISAHSGGILQNSLKKFVIKISQNGSCYYKDEDSSGNGFLQSGSTFFTGLSKGKYEISIIGYNSIAKKVYSQHATINHSGSGTLNCRVDMEDKSILCN